MQKAIEHHRVQTKYGTFYICSNCGTMYTWEDGLLDHIKIFHVER